MTDEIWIADFEFTTSDGNNPHPVCFCATELKSNQTIKMWLDGIEKPTAPIDFKNPNLTYVAYFSVAEMSCHLALGWDMPENIVDLFCEWRVFTNDGSRVPNSLLNACENFGIPTIDQAFKDKMRERILQGPPYIEIEKQEILDYCETDIVETIALFRVMQPKIDNWERALFRGKYMAITALIEHNGVPIDVETLTVMQENWELIKLELIDKVNKDFEFFDGLTFKSQAFADYLYKNNMAWTLTEKGNLSMDDDTWKEMCLVYPQLQPIRDVRALLGKFKKLHVCCGIDGRNRGMLSPFSTKTGRNAPKVQCIFTNPSWLRCLIKPKEGEALAYIDYEQQEFMVAAVLSSDMNMQQTYNSGDPYLQFAKMAGAIPPEGTKKTHKEIRDLYKQSCLAIQYGMRAASLSVRVNRPLAYANELIKQHQRLFPRYWAWQDEVITQSKLTKKVETLFGWHMKVVQGTSKEDLTLGNFLMQSTGADILRIACYLLNEAGIKIVAPVHDALMISVDLATADQDIKIAEEIMHKASKVVLGQPLRTETVVVKCPDHYIDEKGKATWEKVQKILQGIQDGTIKADYDAFGSKWTKHANKLERMSHNNLTTWFKGIEKDQIDFESLKDSTLSATENRKNLKGMWREHL
jgi:hypothetical protein